MYKGKIIWKTSRPLEETPLGKKSGVINKKEP